MKIIGVVVAYHPDQELFNNIESYVGFVNELLIVDNTEGGSEAKLLEQKFHNVKYIGLGCNFGIAKALNVAAEYAINNGADWLLTMDQDSKFINQECGLFLKIAYKQWTNEGIKSVGIISATHNEKNRSDRVVDKTVVMTSGNLVNLRAYQIVNGFDDKLFIDAVDYDFCLRLKERGFKVSEYQGVVLQHKLGVFRKIYLFNFSLNFFTHSPQRRYYMTRNALYYWGRHFKGNRLFIAREIIDFSRNFLEIILFSQNRVQDIKYVCRGIKDYILKRYGELK